MKKRLLGFLLGVMLISVCVGCGAESTTTEATETTTAESTTEQKEEATATPEETTAPTPEAKEEPSEETTAETEPETTAPTETVAPEPTEEPTPEPEPQAIYTYTDMSATMYAQQTVNVRDLPDTSGNKLGSLSTNDEITISGQCNETSWYRFEYNGSVAYVSNKYVGDNKVEAQQSTAGNSTAGTGNANAFGWSYGYDYGVWYDMGEYYFYICKTREELFQVSGTCTNGLAYEDNLWRRELMSRYPDRDVYYGGTETNDGKFIAIAATSIGSPGEPSWYRPKFIWE